MRFAPDGVGSDESDFVIERSAEGATVVSWVTELFAEFASVVALEIEAVLEITVPPETPELTFTTNVNVAVCNPRLPAVQLMAPVPPTEGLLQLQLPGGVRETNVVFAGTESESVRLVAVAGPLFVTLTV